MEEEDAEHTDEEHKRASRHLVDRDRRIQQADVHQLSSRQGREVSVTIHGCTGANGAKLIDRQQPLSA